MQLQHNANVSPRANDGRDGKNSATILDQLQRNRNANGIENFQEDKLPSITSRAANSPHGANAMSSAAPQIQSFS